MLNNEVKRSIAEMGVNISAWRKLLGLTALQVSERAGISTVTYSKIENGSKGVSIANILAVFRALGLLSKVVEITDPYNSDLGRARADLKLPKRVRL